MNSLVDVFREILVAFRNRDSRKLRKINDDIMILSATHSDKLYFRIAVYTYVLSKILSKPRFLKNEYNKKLLAIAVCLQKIFVAASGATPLDTLFYDLEKNILDLEKHDSRFLTDLLTKGRLKMAAVLYAQGMSLGVASEMTGLEKQEILSYAGETMMFDRLKEEKSISERMKVARKFIES